VNFQHEEPHHGDRQVRRPAPPGGFMNRDPRWALSQEREAKQTLLDQLRALATDDPDFFTDLLEGETNLLELIAALDASIVDDEILVDGAKTALDKLQTRKRTAETRIELKRRLPRPHPAADRSQDPAHADRDAHPRGSQPQGDPRRPRRHPGALVEAAAAQTRSRRAHQGHPCARQRKSSATEFQR
jgi:hypothetical protein